MVCLWWLWPDFVGRATARGEFKRVRTVLHFLLLVQSFAEISMWTNGIVYSWMFIPIILTNICGMLDAILRYPVVHQVDTTFTLKQALVVVFRFLLYAIGYKKVGRSPGWFLLWQLAGVLTLPTVWLAALPIDDPQCNHMKHGAMEEDILVRVWRMATSPADRKLLGKQLRVLTCRGAVKLVSVVPSLKTTVILWDPSLARVISKAKLQV